MFKSNRKRPSRSFTPQSESLPSILSLSGVDPNFVGPPAPPEWQAPEGDPGGSWSDPNKEWDATELDGGAYFGPPQSFDKFDHPVTPYEYRNNPNF